MYLIYNESYQALEGETLTRADLAEEALRLARLLFALLPLPETEGLLALILHHDARRAARSRGDALIPLEAQDPDGWDADIPTFPAGEKMATRKAGGAVINAIASHGTDLT